jgi:hypothetical protein
MAEGSPPQPGQILRAIGLGGGPAGESWVGL